MIRVTQLFRHPLKSHGREAVDEVTLQAGKPMPWDRTWAVAHEAARIEDGQWASCANFSRGAKAPALMAITASLDESREVLTLRHPLLADLTFHPDSEGQALIDWVMPIVPTDRALPVKVHRLSNRGFTDTDFPSVSLCNMASHRAVEDKLGTPLSNLRWRGNIWFDAPEAWSEFDWVGKDIRVGRAKLRVREAILRCLATTANPDSGVRDADTLGALNSFGHQDFGVYAEVIERGPIAAGDRIEVL